MTVQTCAVFRDVQECYTEMLEFSMVDEIRRLRSKPVVSAMAIYRQLARLG
jgi:hypothetical protein